MQQTSCGVQRQQRDAVPAPAGEQAARRLAARDTSQPCRHMHTAPLLQALRHAGAADSQAALRWQEPLRLEQALHDVMPSPLNTSAAAWPAAVLRVLPLHHLSQLSHEALDAALPVLVPIPSPAAARMPGPVGSTSDDVVWAALQQCLHEALPAGLQSGPDAHRASFSFVPPAPQPAASPHLQHAATLGHNCAGQHTFLEVIRAAGSWSPAAGSSCMEHDPAMLRACTLLLRELLSSGNGSGAAAVVLHAATCAWRQAAVSRVSLAHEHIGTGAPYMGA